MRGDGVEEDGVEEDGVRGTVVVLAKAPVPGRVKTRLHPPLSLERAADLAAAALADVLAAATGTGARVVLALDGAVADVPGGVPDGVVVVPQVDGGLDRRIAGAVAAAADADAARVGGADAGEPVALVGMDTPQVVPGQITAALAAVGDGGADAALGPAFDGGWWALALRRPHDVRLVLDVPTSRDDTGALTLAALRAGGLDVARLPEARDVDAWEDALAVAAQAPGTRFAAAVRAAAAELPPGSAEDVA
ncbi:DUF2064 domain-containing protein [Pseudokineococcus basanitobsidens]|uniref:DUF2064 domain-containing protein n=1 Tax=Pseudokineococcus basanitobsidens TaxID=1926649 RepID=A0ABU8RL13_9ACTN